MNTAIVLVSLFFSGAASLAIVAFRKSQNIPVFSFLIYISTYFIYTIPFLIFSDNINQWFAVLGGFWAAQLGRAAVLILFLTVVVTNNWEILTKEWPVYLRSFGPALVLAILGYLLHFSSSGQWLKDVAAHIGFFVVALVFMVVFRRILRARDSRILLLGVGASIVILSANALVGLHEIVSLRAWAAYTTDTGDIVRRASGLFFNPNLFGTFLGFEFIFLVYVYDLSDSHRAVRFVYVCSLLLGVGIFLSGSRSAALGIVLCGLLQLLLRRRLNFVTLYSVVALGFFSPLAIAHIVGPPAKSIDVLAERWANLPKNGMIVVLNRFALGGSSTFSEGSDEGSDTENFEIAVEGRFFSPIRDNGLLAAYDNGGLLAFASIPVIWATCALLLWRLPGGAQSALRAHLVVGLVYTVVLSQLMRSWQVFPVWIFSCLIMSLIVAYASSLGLLKTQTTVPTTQRRLTPLAQRDGGDRDRLSTARGL